MAGCFVFSLEKDNFPITLLNTGQKCNRKLVTIRKQNNTTRKLSALLVCGDY